MEHCPFYPPLKGLGGLYSLYFSSKGTKSSLDVLVATVYLPDVVDAACALRTHGSDEEGNACTDVRARHTASMELAFVVVTYHNGSVWVAKDNLCAHINKLIDKKQAALEHLLVNKDGALGWCAYH
jgi:hypothetical protein